MENKTNVAVIEDDHDINNLIAYNLRKEGYCVRQIFEGISAERELKDFDQQIVILDIMLPGIDGFSICRKIKEKGNGYKSFVIVVSAKNSEQDRLYAHILGADCYLTKPFSMETLINAVGESQAIFSKEFSVKVK